MRWKAYRRKWKGNRDDRRDIGNWLHRFRALRTCRGPNPDTGSQCESWDTPPAPEPNGPDFPGQ
jgi:hypothetical protein